MVDLNRFWLLGADCATFDKLVKALDGLGNLSSPLIAVVAVFDHSVGVVGHSESIHWGLTTQARMWYGSCMKADAYIRSLDFEAYRVGGSVRDEILGRQPKDADYVIRNTDLDTLRDRVAETGGKPSKLQLRDGRQIGVRANVKGLGLVEIALPRTEVSTGPGRHDFEIVVDPALSLREDANRRDFTINALYRDIGTGDVLDPLQTGVDAVKQRVLITTHPQLIP